MEFKNVTIIGCKIGRDVEIDYLNHLDGRSYQVRDEELPHPHLRKALSDLTGDLAKEYYVLNDEIKEMFAPTGFKISTKEGITHVNITGGFKTNSGNIVKVSSGNIEFDSDPTESFTVRVNTLRVELYEYFFNGKNAQGKLDFKEDKKK